MVCVVTSQEDDVWRPAEAPDAAWIGKLAACPVRNVEDEDEGFDDEDFDDDFDDDFESDLDDEYDDELGADGGQLNDDDLDLDEVDDEDAEPGDFEEFEE